MGSKKGSKGTSRKGSSGASKRRSNKVIKCECNCESNLQTHIVEKSNEMPQYQSSEYENKQNNILNVIN